MIWMIISFIVGTGCGMALSDVLWLSAVRVFYTDKNKDEIER